MGWCEILSLEAELAKEWVGVARRGGEELTGRKAGNFNSLIMVLKAEQCFGQCGCGDAPKGAPSENSSGFQEDHRASCQSRFWEEGGCDTSRVTWSPLCTAPALAALI